MSREQDFMTTFEAVFDVHPDAVFLQTRDGAIVDCNPAAGNLTGYAREELLALRRDTLFGEDLSDVVAGLFDGDNPSCSLSGSCFGRNGSCIPATIDMRAFSMEGAPYVFVAVRDNSERVRTQEEIGRLERRLRQSEKLEVIGRLAGGISHYYNNIFTGILGALDMAKRDASSDMLPLLRRAEKVANMASGFSRRLLAFTRETGETVEPTDIAVLVDDVVDFARTTFDRRIEIEACRASYLDAVLGDPAELHHMLLNLLVNARDALLDKSASVGWEPRLAITITAENVIADGEYVDHRPGAKRGRYVMITVADTGCGMDKETARRAFDPFFTTKEPGRGTGLGLASALSAVEDAGGWIDLDTAPGEGTTVTIHLPSVTLKKTVVRDNAPEELPRGTETVLVIDDDDMIRTLGTMTLERQGYTVHAASNGREGIELFMRFRSAIGLVVLDLLLPGLPGGEVLGRIRRVEPDIPVIVTSGHDFERDKALFSHLRADDYIQKPFTVTDLTVSVRNVLDRRS